MASPNPTETASLIGLTGTDAAKYVTLYQKHLPKNVHPFLIRDVLNHAVQNPDEEFYISKEDLDKGGLTLYRAVSQAVSQEMNERRFGEARTSISSSTLLKTLQVLDPKKVSPERTAVLANLIDLQNPEAKYVVSKVQPLTDTDIEKLIGELEAGRRDTKYFSVVPSPNSRPNMTEEEQESLRSALDAVLAGPEPNWTKFNAVVQSRGFIVVPGTTTDTKTNQVKATATLDRMGTDGKSVGFGISMSGLLGEKRGMGKIQSLLGVFEKDQEETNQRALEKAQNDHDEELKKAAQLAADAAIKEAAEIAAQAIKEANKAEAQAGKEAAEAEAQAKEKVAINQQIDAILDSSAEELEELSNKVTKLYGTFAETPEMTDDEKIKAAIQRSNLSQSGAALSNFRDAHKAIDSTFDEKQSKILYTYSNEQLADLNRNFAKQLGDLPATDAMSADEKTLIAEQKTKLTTRTAAIDQLFEARNTIRRTFADIPNFAPLEASNESEENESLETGVGGISGPENSSGTEAEKLYQSDWQKALSSYNAEAKMKKSAIISAGEEGPDRDNALLKMVLEDARARAQINIRYHPNFALTDDITKAPIKQYRSAGSRFEFDHFQLQVAKMVLLDMKDKRLGQAVFIGGHEIDVPAFYAVNNQFKFTAANNAQPDTIKLAVLAANDRWGCVTITPDSNKAFQRAAIKAAVELGLPITNPELQKQYQQELAAYQKTFAKKEADYAKDLKTTSPDQRLTMVAFNRQSTKIDMAKMEKSPRASTDYLVRGKFEKEGKSFIVLESLDIKGTLKILESKPLKVLEATPELLANGSVQDALDNGIHDNCGIALTAGGDKPAEINLSKTVATHLNNRAVAITASRDKILAAEKMEVKGKQPEKDGGKNGKKPQNQRGKKRPGQDQDQGSEH